MEIEPRIAFNLSAGIRYKGVNGIELICRHSYSKTDTSDGVKVDGMLEMPLRTLNEHILTRNLIRLLPTRRCKR